MPGKDYFEKKILRALNLEQKTNFKLVQFMEWSTGKVKPEKGEKIFFVKEYGVNVAIKN